MSAESWSCTLTGNVDRPRYAAFSLVLVAGAWLLDAATRQLPFEMMLMASHVVPILYGSLSFDLQCRRAKDSGRGVGYVVLACLALLLAVACFAYGVFGPGSELPHTPVGTASGILFATIYVGMQVGLFLFPSTD
jgi:hypothetical protein